MTKNNGLDPEQIYRDYKDKVMGYVRSHIPIKEDAEDIHAEVFAKVLKHLDSVDLSRASVSTWIYTITRNTVTDYYRTKKYYDELPEDLQEEADPYESIYTEETLSELAAALKTMDEREKDLIVLCYYQNMTLTAISQKMGLTYSQVKTLHKNALHSLKKQLFIKVK